MFITIEGIEGTGKSTVTNALSQMLASVSVNVCTTREPGGTVIAEDIRKVLLNSYTEESVQSDVELMLMFASRLQHVEAKIKPALAEGKFVLCDRFTDASYAYQGGGRGISLAKIAELHNWAIGDFQPDKTFLLDLEPKLALERVLLRNNGKDRIEQESIAFFERVRSTYLELAKKEPKRFIVIDAGLAPNAVMAEIWQEVRAWI